MQNIPKPYTHNLNLSPHILRPTPCTLHPTPHILRPKPKTLRPSPYTLHPTPVAGQASHAGDVHDLSEGPGVQVPVWKDLRAEAAGRVLPGEARCTASQGSDGLRVSTAGFRIEGDELSFFWVKIIRV